MTSRLSQDEVVDISLALDELAESYEDEAVLRADVRDAAAVMVEDAS